MVSDAFDCSNSAPKKIGALFCSAVQFHEKIDTGNFLASRQPSHQMSYFCLTMSGFSLTRVVCMAPAGLKRPEGAGLAVSDWETEFSLRER